MTPLTEDESMDDEPTIEIPLSTTAGPDPDLVDTQRLLVINRALPVPEDPWATMVIETVPVHLLGDPILTMEEPQADPTPLYDQINGARPRSRRAPRRRRIHVADKVLMGMGVMAVTGAVVFYGMVVYGWGAGPRPQAAPTPTRTTRTATPSETPSTTPPAPHRTVRPERTKAVEVVVPRTHRPRPTYSRVVVPPATPSPSWTPKTPSAPVTPSETPERTEASPEPSETLSPTYTPSQSPRPASPSITLEPR